MKAVTVGLTGGYCAGKNEAAVLLENLWSFHVIDVDQVGHSVLEEKGRRVIEVFGPGISDANDGIDRKKLGKLVFSDPDRLSRLEEILHPAMKDAVRKEAGVFIERGTPVCINAALLFKMGLDSLCDNVLLVKASLPVRFRRARIRDGLGILDFMRRIKSQRDLFPGTSKTGPLFSKKSGKNVDTYTVWNSSDRAALQRRIEEYIILIERQA